MSYFCFPLTFPLEVGLCGVHYQQCWCQFNPEPGEEIKCFLAHERNVAESVNKCSTFYFSVVFIELKTNCVTKTS